MGIAAAKGLGIKCIGIDAKNFIDKTPHMILTVLWQAIRMYITQQITLKDTPEIMRLAEEGEDLVALQKLPPETILIRWINYHLAKAGQQRRVANLGKDLADSFALFHVLNRLDDKKCTLDGINDADEKSRAQTMINNALALGVPDVVRPQDICAGNTKVNTLFVSYIFNTKHGLEDLTAEEYEAAGLIDDDIEGSKEERQFRLWINSLNIEGVFVNNLVDECRDGILLCKVVDRIAPGSINWKKTQDPPRHDFDRNGNNNEAIAACKNLKLKLIGIGGPDITKGERKLVLALVWQICKLHYLKLIGGKTEEQVVQWANDLVGGAYPPIKNLKDKDGLSDCVFLIHLCSKLEPRAVNWDIVMKGADDDEKMNNAKYAISCARKLGAIIFCVWEDMVHVNPKQMLIFFATMNEIQQELAEANK